MTKLRIKQHFLLGVLRRLHCVICSRLVTDAFHLSIFSAFCFYCPLFSASPSSSLQFVPGSSVAFMAPSSVYTFPHQLSASGLSPSGVSRATCLICSHSPGVACFVTPPPLSQPSDFTTTLLRSFDCVQLPDELTHC